MVPVRRRAAPDVRRLTLLTEIPAPYRIPLFNALAERVDLRVLFLRERNPDRPFRLHREELQFDWSVLPGVELTLHGRWLVLNRGVVRRLRGSDAVLVGGWNQPAFWEAIGCSRARRVPAVLWVESTERDRRSGRLDSVKRAVLHAADGCIVPGTAALSYLESLGVDRSRIAVAPNAVDARIFGGAKRMRVNGRCRIVTVARLSPEKGIDVLLRAAANLPVEVVVAGAGRQEPLLKELAGANVTFLGNVERDALPQVYADADIAVVPSRSETWGMALNEAALAGLPLVSTTAVGGAHDLIEEGVNGFIVPPDDPAALRDALLRFVGDAALRRSAGARSCEIALQFTPERWADAVTALVEWLAR